VVAETEHVGRAAERLHVSQSPLSRQIQKLEAELGLRLFDRVRRRVRLTPAGRWLLRESRALLAQADQLVRAADRVARGEVGSLAIGFVRTAMWTRVLPTALRRFGRRHPDVHVALRPMPSAQQLAALRAGEIDLGIAHASARGDGVAAARLLTDPFVLAVPRGHPLSRRKRIRPADLDGHSWVALERALHTRLSDGLLAACAAAGVFPSIRYEAAEPVTLLALVEAGVGVALIQRSAARTAPRGIAFRELPWLDFALTTYVLRRVEGVAPLAARLYEELVAGAEPTRR
jgi:DNA-binding transcriptional LysR family regulator